MLSDEWLLRYTPPDIFVNVLEERMNKHMNKHTLTKDEQKDENNITLSIICMLGI